MSDTAALIRQIDALLALNAKKGVLTHKIPGLAVQLLGAAMVSIEHLEQQIADLTRERDIARLAHDSENVRFNEKIDRIIDRADKLHADLTRERDALAEQAKNDDRYYNQWLREKRRSAAANARVQVLNEALTRIVGAVDLRQAKHFARAALAPHSTEPTPGHSPELMKTLAQAAKNLSERPPELRGPFKIPEPKP